MTAPFARLTSIHSGLPVFVDVFTIAVIVPASEPTGTSILIVDIAGSQMSISVAEDSENTMRIVNETLKNLEHA